MGTIDVMRIPWCASMCATSTSWLKVHCAVAELLPIGGMVKPTCIDE